MQLKSYFIAKHRFFVCGLERVNWKGFNLFTICFKTQKISFWAVTHVHTWTQNHKGPRIIIENSRHQNNLIYWCGTDDGKLRTDFIHILTSIWSIFDWETSQIDCPAQMVTWLVWMGIEGRSVRLNVVLSVNVNIKLEYFSISYFHTMYFCKQVFM